MQRCETRPVDFKVWGRLTLFDLNSVHTFVKPNSLTVLHSTSLPGLNMGDVKSCIYRHISDILIVLESALYEVQFKQYACLSVFINDMALPCVIR